MRDEIVAQTLAGAATSVERAGLQALLDEARVLLDDIEKHTTWSDMEVIAAIGCELSKSDPPPALTAPELKSAIAVLTRLETSTREVFETAHDPTVTRDAFLDDKGQALELLRKGNVAGATAYALAYPPVFLDRRAVRLPWIGR